MLKPLKNLSAVRRIAGTLCCGQWLVVITLAAAALPARAQTTPKPAGIEGVVLDTAGRPIASARLVVRDTARTGEAALRRINGTSDSLGRFRLMELAPGPHILEVTRDSYEPAGFKFEITSGITAQLRITLHVDTLWAVMQKAADSILALERTDSIAAALRAAQYPPSARSGKGTLSGRVATEDGKPVMLAQVQAMGTNFQTMTDSAGRFRLTEMPIGPYFLRARKVGYDPVVFSMNLMERDSLDASITLTQFSAARGTQLDTIRVTADMARMSRRLRGFEQRKTTARGIYIDAAEIERRKPTLLTDMLRGRANITVQRNGVGDTQVFGPRLSITTGYCPLALIIDGVLINTSGGRMDNFVPIDNVAGIEVYNSGTSVPGEFQRLGTDCGAVIVWTR
jgi:Carboxypeptidase regulatory-like domain